MATQHLVLRRGRSLDRGPPSSDEAMDHHLPGDELPSTPRPTILTVMQLGPKREITAQGYLLCRDVPIARTGWMIYNTGEVPIKAGTASPVIYVMRTAEELFSPSCMGSFIGAAVCDEHPVMDVTPDNWQTLAKGYIMTVRRGTGEDSDCLMGDLLITNKHLQEQVNGGKREVSLGYDASYRQTKPGEGIQFDIIGNHIALVERGRCGPRCAIGDSSPSSAPIHQPQLKESKMGSKTRVEMIEDARARVKELETEEATGGSGAVHVHVHTSDKAAPKAADDDEGDDKPKTKTLDKAVEERFVAIEKAQADTTKALAEILAAVKTKTTDATSEEDLEAEEEEAAAARALAARTKTGDSVALETSFKEFVSQAEILVPGYRVPTFDAASPRKSTMDSMCMGRRGVLTAAVATTEGKALLDAVSPGFDVSKAGCADVAVVFKAASATKAAINNRQATGDRLAVPGTQQEPAAGKLPTIQSINDANKAFWASQEKRA